MGGLQVCCLYPGYLLGVLVSHSPPEVLGLSLWWFGGLGWVMNSLLASVLLC